MDQALAQHIKTFGIGLTGGIATGKSTVAQIIAQEGLRVIDADQLARQAVQAGSKGLQEVVQAFGPSILHSDGSLNRRQLAQRIFSDPSLKKQLEGILHPLIQDLLAKFLRESGTLSSGKPWFYEAALLFETGTFHRFKSVWLTHCPFSVQLARLMQRNGLSQAEAEAIIQAQMPADEKKALADLIIDTSLPRKELELEVKKAVKDLLLSYPGKLP